MAGLGPTHGQEVGSLQPDGLVSGGRDDGRLGLGCRGGSDDLGPGRGLELEDRSIVGGQPEDLEKSLVWAGRGSSLDCVV